MRIVKESAFRVSARCPEARRCGGCQIQEMDYRKQLEFKNTKVRNNLIRLGSVEEELLDQIMEPIAGMEEPFRYRNKAQFPIGVDKEGNLIAGFYAGRTHQIIPVPNRDCVLGVPENKVILDQILDYMREEKISAYDEERHKGLVRHVLVRYGFTTKEIMVCLIINGDKLPSSEKLLEKLTKIPGMTSITYNINKEKTNVIMGSKVCPLWGQTYITDYIGNVKYQISPLSFYQVNPVQTEVLYGTALEYAGLTGKETVWDVYCGIGTISLFLAQKAQKVYGVEIVPQAIEDAKHNAEINEITNAEFFVGKAEEVLPEYYVDYAQHESGAIYAARVIGFIWSFTDGRRLQHTYEEFPFAVRQAGGIILFISHIHEAEHDFTGSIDVEIPPVNAPGVFPAALVEALDSLINLEFRIDCGSRVVFFIKIRIVLPVVFQDKTTGRLVKVFPPSAPGVPVVSALIVGYNRFPVRGGDSFPGRISFGYFLFLRRSRAGTRNAFCWKICMAASQYKIYRAYSRHKKSRFLHKPILLINIYRKKLYYVCPSAF